MARMFVIVGLAFAASVNATAAEPDRVGCIMIIGNKWTSQASILEVLELHPGMVLPDEAPLLQTEKCLLMWFHERFDLEAGKRPRLQVHPRAGDSGFRDITVHFPEKKPKKKAHLRTPRYSGPKATYLKYLEAIRKCDLQAAKRCWVIEDNNTSEALDVLVGIWLSPRRLHQVALKALGKEGTQAIPEGWRGIAISDQTLDLTLERLADAKVKVRGDVAQLMIGWVEHDSQPFGNGESIIRFRRVAGQWKMDPNLGVAERTAFSKPGTWGSMFRDQIIVMNEAADGMKRGTLKTPKQLKVFIEAKMKNLADKYEEIHAATILRHEEASITGGTP